MITKKSFLQLQLLLFVAFALQACQGTNPVAAANSIELQAYAISGTYGIYQEKGLELIQRGNLPNSVSLRLIAAEERLTPIVDELDKALDLVEQVKADLSRGESTSEQVAIALTELNNWLNQAGPLVQSFKTNVIGAQ